MSRKILIADDEAYLLETLEAYLRREGYQVVTARTGREALFAFRHEQPDLVILDVMMPEMDGWEAARLIRKEADVPLMFLTARIDDIDQVTGLELGADEYVTKPFSARVVVARVRALLRRQAPGRADAAMLRFEGLSIDLLRREVRAGTNAVALTGVEFRLLAALARAPGQALTREALSEAVQPGSYKPQDRTVDVQVARLRRKLREASPGTDWIATERGEGYVFVPR